MSIEQLELYCKQAYIETNSEVRNHAEQACLSIVDNNNCYEMCRLLLERADSHYAQIVAISSLTKLINRNQTELSIDNRFEMRNMCLNYLIQREELADFVVRALIGLISRITKLGWLDVTKEESYPFREIITPLMQMVKSGQPRPMLLGVQILHNIVYEFNQSYEGEINRSTIVIRKIANNFREHQLYEIFLTSLDILSRMSSNIKSLNLYDSVQNSIVRYSLKLTLACLSYDFIGTSGGEDVCDDMISVQVPTNWRQAFLSPTNNPDPVPLFFELFEKLPTQLGELVLSCLVQTASFRRSFFNNNERQLFLRQLILGVCSLMMSCIKPTNRTVSKPSAVGAIVTGTESPTYKMTNGCFHELCRLICRLKSNFQLSELVSLQEYAEFIELLSNFTRSALEVVYRSNSDIIKSNNTNNSNTSGFLGANGDNCQKPDLQLADCVNSNSLHYLLLTWQRLVASLPYLRCTQPHLLDVHCPPVLDAYVRAKLRSCQQYNCASSAAGGSQSSNSTANNPNGNNKLGKHTLSSGVGSNVKNSLDNDSGEGDSAGMDDDLEGANVPQELEAVAILARCQYSRTANMLVNYFDEAVSNLSTKEPIVRLRELSWLILLMGSCVAGRIGGVTHTNSISSSTSGASGGNSVEDCDRLDGELVGRVLQLIMQSGFTPDFRNSTLAFISAFGSLEVATVHFLDQLRRVYLCAESNGRSIKLYECLQTRLGIVDDNNLLETLVGKLLQNLRIWGSDQLPDKSVLNVSLNSLHELSLGAVAKRVVRLPVVQALLQHQSRNEFPFLGTPIDPASVAFGGSNNKSSGSSNITNVGSTNGVAVQLSAATSSNTIANASSNPRTCFYSCLTRLFLLSPNITDEPSPPLLHEFLEPMNHISNSMLNHNSDPRSSKLALLGLLRDIKGVSMACHSKSAFQALFDWLFPAVLSQLLIAVELWSPTDEWGVSLGCLRLMAELCLSRNNRLQPQTSARPSGELIFRCAAAMLSCYVRKLPSSTNHSDISKSPRYLEFIREATACLEILRNILTGNYVNLGALPLYSDHSLTHCLQTFLQLMLIIPPQDIIAFPKLSRAYYALADSISQDHLMWLGSQLPEMILYFVKTIADGLTSTALSISSCSCSSLDNISTFLLRLLSQRDHPDLLANQNGYPTGTCGGATSANNKPVLSLSPNISNCLSEQIQSTIENFHTSSALLTNREAESRNRWRQLVSDQQHNLLPTNSNASGVNTSTNRDSTLMGILARSMEVLLDALMQPECKNQWAMSRPLLGLILLDNKAFEQLQTLLIQQRAGNNQVNTDTLKLAFQRLMEDVNCSLSIRNRDRFTQNLNTFRHTLVTNNQTSSANVSRSNDSEDMIA